VAQLINTIHSLFVAYEDKFVATPNFHVFEMYAAHQGAQAVRALFSAPAVSYKRSVPNVPPGGGFQRPAPPPSPEATLWGLQGSASLNGKQLTLTVVNPHATEAREAEVAVRGASVQSGKATTLSSPEIHARNSFDNPRALVPKDDAINVRGGGPLIYRFAPASVTRLQLTLA
jgi:alpha-N-arabinofuranosidase